MDWSTFIPTLLATLTGVVLSVALSVGVYWLRGWVRDCKQAKETKQMLIEELDANKKILQSHFDQLKGYQERRFIAELVVLGRLRTSAYGIAYQAGRLRLLGDIRLQEVLASLAQDWQFFNTILRWYEDAKIHLLPVEPQKARALSEVLDKTVAGYAEEFLNRTIEVRQKLEVTK